MLNFSLSKKITRFSASFLLAVFVALLTGCGSGGPSGTAVAVEPSITIALTDSTGAPATTLSSGALITVKATMRDAAGAAVANSIIAFSNDQPTLATIEPVIATALTDVNGVATVTLKIISLLPGAGTLTATGMVGTTAVTGLAAYGVGVTAVTVSTPIFGIGAASLSAFGTTSVAVTVSTNGVPVTASQDVSFTSLCATSGKAVLTPSVATVDGVATASYRDNGCAGSDTITASANGNTSSAILAISAPATGSIQFFSATPTSISLKGMGGAGRQESSQVIFKVVDTSGAPIGGKTVNFSLSTAVGGITLSTATSISDPTTGQVQVGINSGTVSTPVRVQASTCTNNTNPCTGTTLTTQSDQLTITTGIPDQQHFSLSATTFNIEGWNVDGTTTDLTVRLADHFGNPVPDGTAVNFTTEGARVAGLLAGAPIVPPVGSCVTLASECSARFYSQNLRPTNGRVTVLAYAVGEEGFTDLNGNGLADNPVTPSEMKDANGISTDMGEIYVDWNENGVRDASEPFTDYGGNTDGTPDGLFNGPDGLYNGVLCDHTAAPGSSAVACSAQQAIHVRGSSVIVLSSSDAIISINGGAPVSLPACSDGTQTSPPGPGAAGGSLTFTVTVVDLHGNAMPAGTTVNFTSDNGTFAAGFNTTYTVPNTSGCRTTNPVTGLPFTCPASAASATFGDIPVTMKSDAIYTAPVAPAVNGTCVNTIASGTFRVTVTSKPGNVITTGTKSIWD